MKPSPTGEAERLVAWLEERGLAVRTHPALREGVAVLVVRAVVPGLREAGLARDELWWPVTPDGDRVLLHPDVHEAQAWWVERALGRDPGRAAPPADVTDRPLPPEEVSPRRWRGVQRQAGPAGEERARRPRGALWRFVAVMAGVALLLAVLIPALRTVRDVRSEGRAEEAASLLAPVVAEEVEAGRSVDEARAAQLLREVVPGETREMRGRYARGDLRAGWVVADPAAAPARTALCVEMRSLAGDDVYAAAWAVGDEVTLSQRGAGCGLAPASLSEAVSRARGGTAP